VPERQIGFSRRRLPPDPAVLLRSLRGIGYSVEDAVSDIVDNSLSAGAKTIDVRLRDRGDDVTVDVVDDGRGLTRDELLIALTLGATERDPGLSRREEDLGRFGLGLKTASFAVAQRMSLFTRRDDHADGAAWDLSEVARTREWLLSDLGEQERTELESLLGSSSGTVVRWSKTDRLGMPDRDRAAALGRLIERLRQHLGMVYHRFIEGTDAEGLGLPEGPVSIRVCGETVTAWNPLVPFSNRPEFVELASQPRIGPGIRVEYAILPPDTQLLAEEREEATLRGRRMTDMQGFYVYRANRLVCFASWLNLPGAGRGRWNKESPTQLARIAVDLTNESDVLWSLDVRKSRVVPPENARMVLVEVGTEARARSRARIFGRTGSGGAAQHAQELPSLWRLDEGRLQVNREHPLVVAVVSPTDTGHATLRAAVRSLLRQLETSPALTALVAEPTSREASALPVQPDVMDDADFGEALDLGRCLIRSGTPMAVVLEIAGTDPRYATNPDLLNRLKARLERD
jgi:hypothetical protein